MTTVRAQQWVSLDGFAAGPTGEESDVFRHVPDFADSQRHNLELMSHVDAVLLGRRTYELFVDVWPDAEGGIADAMAALPRVVASRTLHAAPWGAHAPCRVVPDATAFVREQVSDTGRVILVWGSLRLADSVRTAGLLDELELFVAPVLLGAGRRLFGAEDAVPLRQLDGEVYAGGTTRLRYSLR